MPFPADDFDFDLPPELIAQFPAEERDESRLLICERASAQLKHTRFHQLPSLLRPGDLLVLNNTRVIPARLWGRLPGKNKKVEILLLREVEPLKWECLAKPAKALELGSHVAFESDTYSAKVTEVKEQGMRELVFQPKNGKSFTSFLEEEGKVPLPPYIRRDPTPLDRMRYQTVFAQERGSVAAPTAGLHFTQKLLNDLEKQEVELAFVTLHVGLGTFRPVGEKEIRAGKLHPEIYEIPPATAQKVNEALDEGRRVIAVGTTSVRALESAAQTGLPLRPGRAETNLFIYPPFEFRIVKGIVTNFHLPQSSLLMLVCAFAGHDFVFAAYKEAIQKKFHFYSYGDAMLII